MSPERWAGFYARQPYLLHFASSEFGHANVEQRRQSPAQYPVHQFAERFNLVPVHVQQ